MVDTNKLVRTFSIAGAALVALAAPALADDSKLTYAITIGATSDYVFRGVTQTGEDPAFQAAVDVGYGIFYAGVWGSGINFAGAGAAEIDIYAGVKPVLGPLTFDAGVLYYAYPDQDSLTDVDYIELKLGVSASPVKNLTLGVIGYWSPEYTFETGEVWTIEGNAAYTFPTIGIVTPTVSGLIGYQEGDDAVFLSTNGFDNFTYWNAGLALAVEKFTFDFRYWDTDIDESNPTYLGLADERFVFSAKVVLP